MSETSQPPWKKPAPTGIRRTKLTPQSRAKARSAAMRAGRPYPNLVDNMQAAKEQKAQASGRTRKRKS